ncbi:hypothetical protein BIW11_11084 [Tropilaelaps mercedesae]|uniref:Uncharacterized protein n=1 Tax=Tropilaelaps mercedesae TaxID=418985 RepID=A0A1V9XD91_9ACAR|nr:hypothetical protein BIW11_11084 [Tropilaelaps mercedesae]
MLRRGSSLANVEQRYYAAEMTEPTGEEYLTMLESWIIDLLYRIVRAQMESLLRVLVSPSDSPEPEEPSSEDFAEMFKTFAKFGDSKGSGDLMSLSNSDRWWKQARVIDGRRVTTTDTGIYFRKIAK